MTYSHILVGLDLSDDCPKVLAKAASLAKTCNAKLSLVHVIEPLALSYGGDLALDLGSIQEQQTANSLSALKKLASNIDVPVFQEHVLIGQAANEMRFLAKEENCDLILVGSHGRKGLALLLGSTSNSVLHGAQCDVLAVLVK
jgi:universal stress protein A